MICDGCGCTESRPCIVTLPDGSEGPCWWVEPGACSGCIDDLELGSLPRAQAAGAPAFRNAPLPRRVA